MAGVSWYAVIQWAVAARRPAHLAAINPWEGWTDLYKEVLTHGGIPETQFGAALGPLIANTHVWVEDVLTNSMNHPVYDEYWQSKAPDLTAIEVPTYVVASWSNHGLQTRGTLEAFRRIASKPKWPDVHGRTTTNMATALESPEEPPCHRGQYPDNSGNESDPIRVQTHRSSQMARTGRGGSLCTERGPHRGHRRRRHKKWGIPLAAPGRLTAQTGFLSLRWLQGPRRSARGIRRPSPTARAQRREDPWPSDPRSQLKPKQSTTANR